MNIAIVEDEQIYIDEMVAYLGRFQKEIGESIDVTIYRDGLDFVTKYKGDQDIIFLDIQMPLMDGMTTAEKIRQVDEQVIIMFVTNMSSYAIRGYEVDALDYILKPVNYFAFSKKLKRAMSRVVRAPEKFVTLTLKEGIKKLEVRHITYIESQGHQLNFYTKDKDYITRGTLKAFEEELEDSQFFRINKGVLVNISAVSGIKDNCCVVGEVLLPISRQRKKKFMEDLTNYMSEVMR